MRAAASSASSEQDCKLAPRHLGHHCRRRDGGACMRAYRGSGHGARVEHHRPDWAARPGKSSSVTTAARLGAAAICKQSTTGANATDCSDVMPGRPAGPSHRAWRRASALCKQRLRTAAWASAWQCVLTEGAKAGGIEEGREGVVGGEGCGRDLSGEANGPNCAVLVGSGGQVVCKYRRPVHRRGRAAHAIVRALATE